MMKNLKDLEKLSDAEFLNFLYLEKDRQSQKSSYPGWSLWAIGASIFALAVYVYFFLKDCNCTLDWMCCYYIFSISFPVILYLTLILEYRRIFNFGDSKHVATIGSVSPSFLLAYQFVISISLFIVGLIINAPKVIITVWGICAIPSIISGIVILRNRNKLTITARPFTISPSVKTNSYARFFFFGVTLLPINFSYKHLSFGFSSEFEFTMCLILIIFLVYIIIRQILLKPYMVDFDELIDMYLYYDWSKSRIIKEIEYKSRGSQPIEQIQKDFDALVDFSVKIPALLEKSKELGCEIKKPDITINRIETIIDEINNIEDDVSKYTQMTQALLKRAKELLDLRTPILDDDFRTVLDSLRDLPEIKEVVDNCRAIQEEISTVISPFICMHYGGLCLNMDCNKRNKPLSKFYSMYYSLTRKVKSKKAIRSRQKYQH